MSDSTAENSVTLSPEGYVLVELVGKQDYLSMEKVGKKCMELADQLNLDNKPVIGLIDFSKDTSFSPGTNKAALTALEDINYDRAAMFGADPVLSGVTKAMVAALGKGESTKVFSTKEEALAWLLMRDPLFGYGQKGES